MKWNANRLTVEAFDKKNRGLICKIYIKKY